MEDKAIEELYLQRNDTAKEYKNDTYLSAWDSIPPHRCGKLQLYLARITRNLSFNRYHTRNAAKRGAANSHSYWMNWQSVLRGNLT